MAKERYYFQWGNETPGHVSVWKKGQKDEVILLGKILKTEALKKNYKFAYPFN